ncbi:hypothetical protein RclHR1_02510026 [Rhizophagus clarus]|uniref:Uncharacterized protein n=1 Tax=Rhizophagus clarus TaxID=94130 RepID=A0A2Z6R3F0_9GLOM|nr:hypothetical protein RclHR1_02510026 [Rhizophagus clarus]GES98613.1 hypothetical protein GLOIN_2v1677319 [Rhizophagus clarus]
MSTTITISVPEDQIQQDSIRGEPPVYSEDNNSEVNNNPTTSANISLPTTAHLSLNSSSLPNISTNLSAESLPSYDKVTVDMPPSYPTDNSKLVSLDSPYDLVPIEPQNPWPISKKFYIFGFLLWPLWYIGIPYSFFGKDQETKRWGRRCIYNSIIISIVFCYLIVAYKDSIINS